eukprot:11685967-Alexandrium_andersonii.AAC.1
MGPPIPAPVRTGLRTASPEGRQCTATLSLMNPATAVARRTGPARSGPTRGASARTPCSDRQEERHARGWARPRQG